MADLRCIIRIDLKRGFLLLSCCMSLSYICYGCPTVTNTGDLSFTKNITDRDSVRYGQNIVLLCCTAGYDSLLWFHRLTPASDWQPYPPYCDWCTPGTVPNLQLGNQSLIIPKAGSQNNGQYLCVASNTTENKSISHTTSLHVYSCVKRSYPLPLPPHDIYTKVNRNVTFTCGGDFGCKQDDFRDVSWNMRFKSIDSLNQSRYIQTKSAREHGTLLQANLTIINVQPEDFDVVFTCYVTSDVLNADRKYDVKLKKAVTYTTGESVARIVGLFGGVFGALLITVLIVVVVVKRLYGPQISLYVKSRIPGAHFLQKDDKKYHVFIYHGEEETEELNFANVLKIELQNRGYSVACVMDIMGNQNVLALFGQYTSDSAAIFFVESNLNETCDMYLMNALADFSPQSITVVLRTDTSTDFTQKKEFKALFKVQWPGEGCSERKKNKFFSSLCLRLPRPTITNENTTGHHPLHLNIPTENEEERGLLQTPDTTSPDVGGNPAFTFVPVLNEERQNHETEYMARGAYHENEGERGLLQTPGRISAHLGGNPEFTFVPGINEARENSETEYTARGAYHENEGERGLLQTPGRISPHLGGNPGFTFVPGINEARQNNETEYTARGAYHENEEERGLLQTPGRISPHVGGNLQFTFTPGINEARQNNETEYTARGAYHENEGDRGLLQTPGRISPHVGGNPGFTFAPGINAVRQNNETEYTARGAFNGVDSMGIRDEPGVVVPVMLNARGVNGPGGAKSPSADDRQSLMESGYHSYVNSP